MLILFILDVALTILEWLLGLFPDTLLDLPEAISLTIPVPFIGSGGTSAINQWFGTAVTIALALVAGKVLQWIYSLIPLKGT